ncbi:MAG TPA: acetyl/propionyl/methylcrotonyl-CoA carboxylase subunit alpha [Bauldia sp.]|nr:acetyl/propionyl/methylcrotonyl-CoA carboxylase subunit alpha [Bauldia sp.]
MFQKILIANRGEIAVRIMRTARRMGIATVAVYCDSDRDALHVEMADEAVNIGPPPAVTSYLVIHNIIEACRKSGAEAVHPGYGFLSERADFAARLEAEGIAFIGPNAKAIAALGDKIASKKLALAAGVRTVPGLADAIADEAAAVAAAAQVGLPVMIKASAGGGGKGMRIARSLAEVGEAWRLSRSEAKASFGDDRIFIERYIENPRHIEVQVLGDKRGQVIHLGERECSIQRRNQKIIEEAPSPAVDAELRAEMGRQAVALANAVGYDSAGTVEFVFGEDRQFYFLEMNTRLQVEHPVTEFVTGLDLVEEMIRIAAGEPLRFGQADVKLDGWAIEARLCAEDPVRDFLPSIGRLDRLQLPPAGHFDHAELRIDSGVVEGSEISIHFDSLLAKVIVHAPNRRAATEAMRAALDGVVVDGILHNASFLSALMAHPRWAEARLSAGFLREEYPDGFRALAPSGTEATSLAAIAAAIDLRRNGHSPGMQRRVVRLGDIRVEVEIAARGEGDYVAVIAGREISLRSGWRPGGVLWSGYVDGAGMTVQVRPITAGIRLDWRGISVPARVMTPRVAELDALMPKKAANNSSKALRCPMPGLLTAIHVGAGQKVGAGQSLAIVEAMKMANVLRADHDATVARIVARQGDILPVGAVILEFE